MSDEEDKDVNFLKRWSGRKTALREEQPVKQATVSDYDEVILPDRKDENDLENVAVPEDLPDIDTLNKDSDFSLFMREGTPEHLKKIALRKLFNSDPAFSVLDGLNDYDDDYSMIGMVAEAVSTRYKPGQGIVSPEDELKVSEDDAIQSGDGDSKEDEGSSEPLVQDKNMVQEDDIEPQEGLMGDVEMPDTDNIEDEPG